MPETQPLAARMRPQDLDEFVGQSHLVGEGRVLRKAMDAGQLPSMILWGPPGTGKTTLAAIGAKRAGARFVALNALELAADAVAPGADGKRGVGLEEIRDAMQRRSLLYDRAGDQHYDTISAFIKSVRGSDPDAALYWLVRMIDSGEDPMFIARRLVIL